MIVRKIQVIDNVDKNKDDLRTVWHISVEAGSALYPRWFAHSRHLLLDLVLPAPGLVPLGCSRLQIICDAIPNFGTDANTKQPPWPFVASSLLEMGETDEQEKRHSESE